MLLAQGPFHLPHVCCCCSVTPRRWLAFCNPPLRQLITETLGNERWINDTDRLKVGGAAVNFTPTGGLSCYSRLAPCVSCCVQPDVWPSLTSAVVFRLLLNSAGAAVACRRPGIPAALAGGEAAGQGEEHRAD